MLRDILQTETFIATNFKDLADMLLAASQCFRGLNDTVQRDEEELLRVET